MTFKKSKSKLILDVNSRAMSFPNDDNASLIISLKDVTEQKESENKLALSEKRFKSLVQEGSDMTAIVDSKGIYSYVSPNYFSILGYSETDLVGKCAYYFMHPDEVDFLVNEFKKLEYQPRVKPPYYRFKRKDNSWAWVRSVGTDLRKEESIGGFVINSVEISDLIQSQNTLQKSNEKFELINKITRDVIYEWEMKADQFHWEESFSRIFEYAALNKPKNFLEWLQLIHPQDREQYHSNWKNFITNPKENKWVAEFRLKKNNNTYAFVEENAFIIRDIAENVIKKIGVLRDVSDKKVQEVEKRIQNEISSYFKEDKKLNLILDDVLNFLTNEPFFLASEIWVLDINKEKVKLMAWHAKNSKTENFYKKTKNISNFNKGEGLPGIVWKNQKQEIWNKTKMEEKFLRNAAAKATGINSSMGIPLFNNNNIEAVLVIHSNEDLTKDKTKITPFLQIKNFLGAEIHRKRQEEMHLLMFQAAPDIVAIANNKGYFKKVNPAFCELLGYTEEEIAAKPFTYFLHPDDVNKTHKEYNETISGERNANNFTNRYRTKNGEYRWISWSSSDVFGDDNAAFAYGKNITDITELKLLFEKTATLAEIGSWEYDTTTPNAPFYLSNVIHDILEISAETKIDIKQFVELIHKEDRIAVSKKLNDLIKNKNDFDSEFRIITPQKNTKWVRCIGKIKKNHALKDHKIIGSVQNITKQKTNELELAKKNNYLEAITEIITELLQSNDWYNSLNNVLTITGNAINVDRVYYFEMNKELVNGKQTCSQKIEWTKDTAFAQIENPLLQNVSVEDFKPFFCKLNKEQLFSAITSQVEDEKFKEVLALQNIKSCLVLPILINDILEGFIGFDDCNEERLWTVSEVSFLHNITSNLAATIQRKNTQKELQNTLIERNNILESIGDAFFTLDNNWRITYWNKESERIVGQNRDELLGKVFWEVFPNLVGTLYEENYKTAVKTGKSIYFQDYFEFLNIWLDISIYPSENGLSVYYKDITKTKKHEEDLQASNERFEKSTLATNDAIWDWDIKKNTLYRGDGFTRLFGYEVPKKISDINILELIKSRVHDKEATKVIQSLKKTILDPQKYKWEKEYLYKKANGKYAAVINRGIIIRKESGEAIRIVGAIQDITQLKENEESLKLLNKKLETQTKDLINSNKELEQFAYIASHDLQEPLRMVTSFLTQLENKYAEKLDDKAKQYIDFAVDGANRMRTIILDILEYSKVGKNDEEERNAIDLNTIINDVIKMNQQKIDETNAVIQFDDLPTINGYKSPLIQIFHNLIGNAIKYQKQNHHQPIISITYKKSSKFWTFTVTDNGIGIPKEYLHKIFIIFQRLHTKNEYGGTGMGLAIVKKLVESLGGKVGVTSEIGKGSSFYFTIPRK